MEQNPAYGALVNDIFDRLVAGTLTAITSPVTLVECLVLPLRSGLIQAQKNFVDLVVSGSNVTFVSIDDRIATQAAELRGRYNLGLPDAFQIATSLAAGCDAFLTNDKFLKRVRELPILILDDLEL